MIKFLKHINATFKSQPASTKALIIIVVICLANTALTAFVTSTSTSLTDVAIRSTLSSILGYIFGEHCKKTKFPNENFQIIIAGFTSFICLLVIMILHWTSTQTINPSAVEIRNLLFTSVGFLLSKAKNNDIYNY